VRIEIVTGQSGRKQNRHRLQTHPACEIINLTSLLGEEYLCEKSLKAVTNLHLQDGQLLSMLCLIFSCAYFQRRLAVNNNQTLRY